MADKRHPYHRWLLGLLLAIAFFAMYWPLRGRLTNPAPSKSDARKGGGKSATVPLIATKARKGDIGSYFTGLGAVTPINTVTVRSRVDGQLMAVHYREGDSVHQGDLL